MSAERRVREAEQADADRARMVAQVLNCTAVVRPDRHWRISASCSLRSGCQCIGTGLGYLVETRKTVGQKRWRPCGRYPTPTPMRGWRLHILHCKHWAHSIMRSDSVDTIQQYLQDVVAQHDTEQEAWKRHAERLRLAKEHK